MGFFNILENTPYYIWIILLYLLFIGVKNITTRIVYLPKIFIMPVMILLLKFQTLEFKDVKIFLVVVASGALTSYLLHAQDRITIFKNIQSIEIKGSYATLIILISFFIIKYVCGYLKAVHTDLAYNYYYVEIIIDAIFSGYFLGQSTRYTYQYFKTK